MNTNNELYWKKLVDIVVTAAASDNNDESNHDKFMSILRLWCSFNNEEQDEQMLFNNSNNHNSHNHGGIHPLITRTNSECQDEIIADLRDHLEKLATGTTTTGTTTGTTTMNANDDTTMVSDTTVDRVRIEKWLCTWAIQFSYIEYGVDFDLVHDTLKELMMTMMHEQQREQQQQTQEKQQWLRLIVCMYNCLLGQAYYSEYQYEESVDYLSRAIELDPLFQSAIFYRSQANQQLKNYDLALNDLTTLIEQTRRDDKVERDMLFYVEHRANLYLLMSDKYSESIADFCVLIDKTTTTGNQYFVDSVWYHNRGRAYDQDKRYREANDDYTSYLKLINNDANNWLYVPTLLYRGSTFLRLKQYAEAIADLNVVIDKKPNAFSAIMYRGTAAMASADYNQAVNDFSRLIQADENNHFALYQRAIAQGQLGNVDKAKEDVVMALRLVPNNKVYENLLQKLVALQ